MPSAPRPATWCHHASLCVLVMLVLVLCGGQVTATYGVRHSSSGQEDAPPVNLRILITTTCKDLRQYVESLVGTNVIQSTIERVVLYLESLLGQENFYTVAMFVEMVIRFLAEGAASGLNVIAVYFTEILRVTGHDGGLVCVTLCVCVSVSLALALALTLLCLAVGPQTSWRPDSTVALRFFPLSFPRFTPEGVASVAQWGLLALIGYWLLSVLLRLLLCILRRVFWLLKAAAALWLFGLIVSDSGAGADQTAIRLAGLVLGCVLVGVAFPCAAEKTVSSESRLAHLEGRVKALERRKGEEQ
ncbi:hypothetical protein CRUP_009855 [Coryphaenoides rupestris]|nr:hypothetical protein CRUP_009855 [Coryphaenoides rupestris]